MIRNILLMHAGRYGCRVQTTADSVTDEAELLVRGEYANSAVWRHDHHKLSYKGIEVHGLWAHQYCAFYFRFYNICHSCLTFCLWNDYMVTCSLETDKTYRSNFRFPNTFSTRWLLGCLPNLMPKWNFQQLSHKDPWILEKQKFCVYVYGFPDVKLLEPLGNFSLH